MTRAICSRGSLGDGSFPLVAPSPSAVSAIASNTPLTALGDSRVPPSAVPWIAPRISSFDAVFPT